MPRLDVFAQTLEPRYGGLVGVGVATKRLISGLQRIGIDVSLLSTNSPIPRFATEQWQALRLKDSTHALFPNYYLPPAGLSRTHKTVIIHDLLFRDLPHTVSPAKRAWMNACFSLLARRSDLLVFVSDFSRDRFLHYYGSGPLPSTAVVPNSVVVQESEIAPRPPNQRKLVTTLSAYYPHKNFEAFTRLAATYTGDVEFVVIGRPPNAEQLSRLALATGANALKRVRFAGYIPEDEKQALLSRSDAFVFPSLYEGFGIPPLEAAALGAPVLTSCLKPVIETLRHRASYVDRPDNLEAWREGLDRLLIHPPSPNQRKRWAVQIRSEFAPERCAQQLLNFLPS